VWTKNCNADTAFGSAQYPDSYSCLELGGDVLFWMRISPIAITESASS